MLTDDQDRLTTSVDEWACAETGCPECGRPWLDPARDLATGTLLSSRVLLLALVGLYLVFTFGLRFVSLSHREEAILQELASSPSCVGGASSNPSCDSGAEETTRYVDNSLRAIERQQDRALVGTAIGLLMLTLGLGSAIRSCARGRAHLRGATLVARLWGVGETLIALLAVQVLAYYGDRVVAVLLWALVLPSEIPLRTLREILAFISLMTGG